VTQVLEVEYVLRLFRRIIDEDVDFMGLNRFWCRPDWMICTVLPIPPPQVRPSVIQDNNQRSEDDLTHKLFEIISTNQRLQDKINNNAAKNLIEDEHTVLQYHIATLVDNQIPGVAPSAQRSGRPLKSVQQRLGSKEGRIRYNIQGKRVEFSARSVITPDPNLSIAEIGVPLKIALNLTVPEKVTPYNRDQMYKLIQNGADKHPGAKTIVRPDGRMISLKHVNTREIVLKLGDVVNRHLNDGDIILFNRQPTLHRMSMMGHRVKVLPYNTFRLNVSVTAPYNADFDGDEMNAHIPQSYEASTELAEIAAVPHQIVTPRHAKPLIGVVQDSLVGSYRLTRSHVDFNRREFMNMMMWNKRFEGVVPAGLRVQEGKPARWTGQQVLTQLMPPINLEMGNGLYKDNKSQENYVKIREGVVEQGIFDKDIFSKPSKGVVHVTYRDYGPTDTVNFIDAMQNTIEQFLVYNGFSVGISDLIADEDTRKQMEEVVKKRKAAIENILLQIHLDLFDNSTGKTNQQEFEDKVYTELNKATDESGKIGLGALSDENRLVAMVRAGSKGSTINISQMMACVGQQAPEGKRIPYGFSDRTLPHFKKYDDGAEARGFVESSFIQGLTPQEFFFHAMSGREGLIDTDVKSVTADTKIVVMEGGVTKCVAIGDWIDAHMRAKLSDIEHFPDDNELEMLQLSNPTFIPTVTASGAVSWGSVAAVTRHDPGQQLYEVKTLGGRSVIVPESKSLLIWRAETKTFEKMDTPDVRPGHCMPVTMQLAPPPVACESIPLAKYLSKDDYLYGTDFLTAQQAVTEAMVDREHIPAGWWDANNGKAFTLPYENKGRFVRTLTRSKTDNILAGYVYPFTTNRDHARIPDKFTMSEENGRFLGLFLAEGNVDVKSGYVAITNNNAAICQFVHDWFEGQRVKTAEDVKLNAIGGVSTTVRGYSTVLAKFFDLMAGHGAGNKRVPAEVFAAPESFIVALLDGYFSGDGTVSQNSVEASSASKELIEGINMLLSRLGIFAKVFESQLTSNNLGTEVIQPTYRLSIRAQWAQRFADRVSLIDDVKESKLVALEASSEHRNFPFQNDVVLDEIVEITPVRVDKYPKLYDLTIPETFTFGLANGLQVYDTADTGYIQRQLVKAMEDLTVQYDGSVRDSRMNIVQFKYGEDGINATKIESANLGLAKLSDVEIQRDYGMQAAEVPLANGVLRGEDAGALKAFANQVIQDRKMLVEGVQRSKQDVALFASVNIDRVLTNVITSFRLDKKAPTDLTPLYVLQGIEKLIQRTQPYHKMWASLLRFYLAPHKMVTKERLTRKAFDTVCEMIVTKNWQGWAQPGEQVGIIAAQSIGEPSTQMTLNSVDWDTKIMIAKDGQIVSTEIGDFVDEHMAANPAAIQEFPNNQLYMELTGDWQAISCDESGKMMWTKLEAITRHPVVNEDGTNTILEVTLASGRSVKGTKGKSFLTKVGDKVLDINGSDLRVGDVLPIANSLALQHLGLVKTFAVKSHLPPTDWLYGTDVHAALQALGTDRNWFQKNNGTLFTVPYSRSDAFRDAFVDGKNTNAASIRPGFVYPSRTRPDVSQIPAEIPLTESFGFFVGAYLAEGMSNTTQINITNNDEAYLKKVAALMADWNVGTHTVSEQREAAKSGIKGLTTSLVIHSTLLATLMQKVFGRVSYEKTMPDWVFQAPEEFVQGLVDGYISGDGTVDKKTGCVKATSVSKELLTRFSTLLARFGIFSTLSERTPELGVFDSVRTNYTMTILAKYSAVFAKTFRLSMASKQAILNEQFSCGSRVCRRETTGDMVWDTITSIKEVVPMKERVYDLTVAATRNFMTLDCVALKDTFHLAGVAAKSNVTRGVPRLKELLKVTHNPKAISLTVTLKPEIRDSKEKARKVAQDLELTLLKDITVKAAIYYDPDDSESVLQEDRDLIRFYKAFEEESDSEPWSRLMLRLELDRERMFMKNISMDDIAFVLRQKFGEAINLIYSDYNSQRLIMRVRIPPEMSSGMDDLLALKKLQNRLLTGIVIRGVPGIKAVNFRQDKDTMEFNAEEGVYKAVTQYVLDTDGTNFLAVMNHPYVDGTKLTSSHVHDVYETLGIEATRSTLIQEITTLFEEAGVNCRHLGLLCDVMTRAGRLMSVDRYGINKMDIGPLAKASFEETEKILLSAALFGEMDPVTGISANIMMGQPIRGGTGFFDILFDESAFMRLQEGMTPLEGFEEEGEGPTQEEINAELYEEDDMCSTARLRMNVAMPQKAVLMDEADVEITIMDQGDA
jgi:DNA-directed RNA polymerase beta' subunit